MGGHGEERRQRRQSDDDEDDHAVRLPYWTAFGTDHIISKFSGQDKTYSAARWAQDIDENSEIFQWTPLQTLIVARKSLTGTAALWLKSEKPFKSWDDLKAALLKEFPDSIDSKTIHVMMTARKKKKDEKCLDYMLVMKEMGKRGKMRDYVAIKYIIDGIVDSEVNKMVLYGATTYSELKEKIKIYDAMKEKMGASSNRNNKPDYNDKAANRSNKRRYSCGERNHQSSECPNKEKGLKCFKCNEFGHISTQCKQQATSNRPRHRRRRVMSPPSQRQSQFASLTERFLRIEEQRIDVDHRNSLTLEALVNRKIERDRAINKALLAIGEGLKLLSEALKK